jgi:hypothetical protein
MHFETYQIPTSFSGQILIEMEEINEDPDWSKLSRPVGSVSLTDDGEISKIVTKHGNGEKPSKGDICTGIFY